MLLDICYACGRKNPERNEEVFTPIREENVVGELYVPERLCFAKGNGSFVESYVFEYNGYETTDKIVYDKEDGEYILRRNVIDKSRLTEIDFAEVEKTVMHLIHIILTNSMKIILM